MICRKIHQKTPLSFKQWWRWACSATSPPPTAAPVASSSAYFGMGSLSRAEIHSFTNSRMLFFSKNRHREDSMSIPFGIKGSYFTTQAMADVSIGGVVDVPLAQTGEGIAECELLKWFVLEGDHVEEFQPLCEVQSDKATIEITSRYKGKIFTVLHAPGSIVRVGETLLKMVVDENPFSNESNEAIELVRSLDSDASDSMILKEAKIGGVLSTPAIRSLAKELNVNIQDVPGTGKDGRVLKEDVMNYAAQVGIIGETSASFGASSSEQVPEEGKGSKDVSSAYGWEYEDRTLHLRGIQRAMVKSMTLAAKIPHFHYVEEINCNSLVELKATFQKENSDPSVKFTFLPLLIKSLSMALSKYPLLNSSFYENAHEVILKGAHNIGIAMATPHGLVVPNIKKVQSLSILEITKELSRLQQLALSNKLNPEDISGGTITLSNIGAVGGKFGSPLINVPEVSIIAIGRIQRIPRFDEDGNLYPASVMTVNIGADHRVLDGATVAMFCNEWKQFIEKPDLMMLRMI